MMVREPQNPSYFKKKILFVDPDTMSYRLVCFVLANYAIEIIHARCGLNAIRIFRENPFIDGVITELRVPGLDGFGILRAIRRVNPKIFVIAQTASVIGDTKQRCLEAGFDEFIAKPVDLGLFISMVIDHVYDIQ